MMTPKIEDQLLYFNDEKNQIDVATLELYDWRDAELTLEKNGIQVIQDDIDPNLIKKLVENTDTSKVGFRATSVPFDKKLAIEYYKEVEKNLVEKMHFDKNSSINSISTFRFRQRYCRYVCARFY